EKRFFEETRWEHALPGELILEAGSGSGRFTEQAVSTGAMVISFDYSYAVEANYASNGHHPNLLIVQADIYRMPFRPESFPKVFCFGVLQHTPDPERSLRSLVQVVSPGGNLVVDVYKRRARFKHMLVTKYWVRPLTRKMDPARLYRLTPRHVRLMWPLAKWIHRLPYGRIINWQLLIADYRGTYDLREETLKEWAVLDTFDMLSPRYDFPQTIETVTRWCKDAGLGAIEVAFGYNGIEGRGIKPTA
ncbi:MAG: class I SAM-dependent methyltransferase, partial [Candidatus Eisenbacteria bacterium]|nr:class I SAM-dependent methyltransferase [Candidatus Eisenbacteria bacterium]